LSLPWFHPPCFIILNHLQSSALSCFIPAYMPPTQATAAPPFPLPIYEYWLIKEGRDKLTGIKKPQVFGLLAGSHPDHGQTQLVGDGQDNTAPGGTVKFGQDNPVHPDRLLKDPRLVEAVLAGTGIQNQHSKEFPVPQVAGQNPVNFFQFGHE